MFVSALKLQKWLYIREVFLSFSVVRVSCPGNTESIDPTRESSSQYVTNQEKVQFTCDLFTCLQNKTKQWHSMTKPMKKNSGLRVEENKRGRAVPLDYEDRADGLFTTFDIQSNNNSGGGRCGNEWAEFPYTTFARQTVCVRIRKSSLKDRSDKKQPKKEFKPSLPWKLDIQQDLWNCIEE